MALKRFALVPSEREKVCDHPSGFAYTGTIPCTGPLKCGLCGSVLACPSCGSGRVSGPDREGYYDCHDCGIFFKATEIVL